MRLHSVKIRRNSDISSAMCEEKYNRYNAIASYYDILSKLVYGDKLLMAQAAYISSIPPGSHILFVGGGTGRILKNLLEVQDISIDYLEPSSAMMRRAIKNTPSDKMQMINFIQGDHQNIPQNSKYDVALTFFVFDMFVQPEAVLFADTINAALKKEAIWLLADFFPSEKFLHKIMLNTMYTFFRITTHISARSLPEYDGLFSSNGFHPDSEVSLMKGFVRSRIYRR